MQGVQQQLISYQTLPEEIKVKVFSFLDKKDLSRMMLVSKQDRRIAQDDQLWKPFWEKHTCLEGSDWNRGGIYERERDFCKAFVRYFFRFLPEVTQKVEREPNVFLEYELLQNAFLGNGPIKKAIQERLKSVIYLNGIPDHAKILMEAGGQVSKKSFFLAVRSNTSPGKLQRLAQASHAELTSETLKAALASGRGIKTIKWLIGAGVQVTPEMWSPKQKVQRLLEKTRGIQANVMRGDG